MSRFSLVDAALQNGSAAAPLWRFFVPGRIEVFGKHTDYAGGRSLLAAVPRGFAVSAAPATDRRVVVVDAATGDRFIASLDAPPGAAQEWHHYALAVVRRLAANFPDADLSTRIAFSSDLPRAAGISSSSALIIALAEALIARARLDETPLWRQTIVGDEDRAAYFGCIENGASFRSLAGDAGVGTHGGSEDHAAIVLSRAGELRQFAFAPLRLERVIAMPAGWTFAVVFTGVHAAKAGDRQADYNRLAIACTSIVTAWRERHAGDERTLGELARAGCFRHVGPHVGSSGDRRREPPDLFDAPAAQTLHRREIGVGKTEVATTESSRAHAERLAERLAHFVREDARVAEAAEAFARGEIDVIGELARASHMDAMQLLRNQVPETNDLVAMAGELGAGAASAFGGGWGGSVWALVRSTDAGRFLGRWLGAYSARHPRRAATGFISPPSTGVIRA
ncbi:MAG: galactokinase [Acidobacteria bacterium]|nr:galactokinase [Acidobacteriota bacterium]MBA3887560.1 galactokinase [Acidobacteriota bacterium]